MAQRSLPYPYHRQDLSDYCGAACGQMVIAGLGGPILDQEDIYIENRSGTFNPAWASPPDGINNTLIRNDPRGGSHFLVFDSNNAINLSQIIIGTIEGYQVPPIASVFDSSHWVVVYGYETNDAAPAGTDPLIRFYVNNPSPDLGEHFNHTGTDNCDTVDHHVSDVIVQKNVWYAEYLLPCQVNDRWLGKYLAVCDPLAKGKKDLVNNQEYYSGLYAPLIKADEASFLAPKLLEKNNLYKDKFFGDRLKKLKPGKSSLVMRLNHRNSYYYIVPMLDKTGNILALVTVDAKSGELNEVGISKDKHSNSQTITFKPLTKAEILKAIGKKFDNEKGTVVIHKEVVTIAPVLVWKACEESLSPFWPFHLVYVGEQRIYVRLDKQVYTSLSDKRKGL